ncbi:uncharacterized protein LOC116960367 isoform X2 [Tyto alba]|uniref:uncharacterized protein LOC116960367 isoform X2 n=1 Tax=Tyto alba TaxID=56313 RepID=UPI001C66F70B|nr:uncharacterized protein LOC116960367 isoform X2 [Tyto alba]
MCALPAVARVLLPLPPPCGRSAVLQPGGRRMRGVSGASRQRVEVGTTGEASEPLRWYAGTSPARWPPECGGTGSFKPPAAAGSRPAGVEPGQPTRGRRRRGCGHSTPHQAPTPPGTATGCLLRSPELSPSLSRPRSPCTAALGSCTSPEACLVAPGHPKSCREEVTLRMELSIPPLGMLLTVPASGVRGLSLPDLALLMWGQKGTGRALAGCGQELLWLKLERSEKGEREPSDWSCRRGREERRRRKSV